MDLSLWVADSKFDGYIDNLTNRLIKKTSISDSVKKESTITEQLKIIILNLYSVYLKDKKKYVGFSRDKLAYSNIPKRYNKVGLSFKSVGVIDALIEMKLIEFVMGVNYPKLKRTSRIRATPKLANEIVKKFKIKPSMIQLARNRPCLIMREKNDESNNIGKDYKDTKKTNDIRNNLIEYNNLIRRSHIDIPNFPLHGIKLKTKDKNQEKYLRIDFESDTTKFTRRIFSNDSWKSGGRFYGGWWQNIPNKDYDWRKYIRINNKPTIEIDYSGLHIVFLYAKKKIDYWNEINKDAYDLSDYGYVMNKKLRNFLKQLFLTILNSESFNQAKASIHNQINITKKNDYGWIKKEHPNKGAVDTWIKEIINDFVDYHKPIKRYLYSGVGIKLQYIDSLIAEKVINHFTQLDIPVLCVHDSFIIQSKYGTGDGDKSLEWVMWCFFQDIVKKEIKTFAFGKTKMTDYFDRPDSIVKFNKDKITSSYWKRVKNHNKRDYVINWYESDS